jgi:DNA invertase Pin-like site-specific DNA recombinase
LDTAVYNHGVALWKAIRRHAVKVHPSALDIAHSYLRYSSPAQADGDSVRRQTALRDAWLKRNPHVRLDTSLTLVDEGVSGYRGEHRTNKKHALAMFLDQVERGRVPTGSYLIVENLDRLTRENPVVSIPAVLNLVAAGIRVVQLVPCEMVYDSDMEQHQLMMLLFELSRGNAESRRKSGMLSDAWGQKKRDARDHKTPYGSKVPAWLELTEDGYRVKEDAGKAIRLIFKLSALGLGLMALARKLNADNVPTIGTGDTWARSYVGSIINNRAVLGEYQPMKGHRNPKPDGEPIPGYFPRVVSDKEWNIAHGAKAARQNRSGRPCKVGNYFFPFSGMLRCAVDRCAIYAITRRGQKHLLSAKAKEGVAGCYRRSFPLDVFTKAVMSKLVELRATDLFADPSGAKIAELTGRLAETEKRLTAAVARFDADPESPTWADRVSKYDREKRALVRELAEARQEAATPLPAAWAEAVELMSQEEPERLRSALLLTVESIQCLFVSRNLTRIAVVQVWFKGGEQRSYLIVYEPAVNRRGARWEASSYAKAGALDLRNRSHVGELQSLLEKMILKKSEST